MNQRVWKKENYGTNFHEGFIREEDYPFSTKPKFSTFVSIKGIKPGRSWQISFLQDSTLRDPSALKPFVIPEENNLSHILVDIYHLLTLSSKLISLKEWFLKWYEQ